MNLTRPAVLGYVLPLLAIIVLAILVTATLFRLADIQRNIRHNVNANMAWVLYQTHTETLMLANALQRQRIEAQSTSELEHRYQMLLSRLHVLNDGPQRRALQELGTADPLVEQSAAIMRLGDRLASASPDAGEDALLLSALEAFSASLLRASGRAMVAQWEESGARIDSYRNAVLTVFFLMIGILASSVVISTQLLLALQKARRNEHARQQGIKLQQQLEKERQVSHLYRSYSSMVSHQFRTPLAIIDATMQRLIRAGDRMDISEIRHRATKAREASQRLTYLVETILEADRFREHLDVSMQPCSLAELARQAVIEKKTLAAGRDIRWVDETTTGSTVLCDPVLTSEILDNLLSNAVKYSADDTPVCVRVYRESGWVCCAVRDQGRGIAAQDIPHVFRRYFRAETTADVAGTGIGLSIANELASRQNGEIHVSSELGAGSIFVLRLPACAGDDGRDPAGPATQEGTP